MKINFILFCVEKRKKLEDKYNESLIYLIIITNKTIMYKTLVI